MVRTIIQLTETQAAALKGLARQRGTSVAALVREAVDGTLGSVGSERAARAARARALAGAMRSGLGDLAEHHDAYLAETTRSDRRRTASRGR